MAATTPNIIKFHDAECNKELIFKSIYISDILLSYKQGVIKGLLVTYQEKYKYYLYNPVELVENYINMLNTYNLLLLNKIYLMGTILKET